MRFLPIKLPLSYLLTGTVCFVIGITSTSYYYKAKLSESAENIDSIKQSARACPAQLAVADSEVSSCNQAHFLNGYCLHSLETCELDKEMLVEEARRLYLVVDDILLSEDVVDDAPIHP